MNTGLDIEFVRERYQKMSDQELIRVSTEDAKGLTFEAIEVVKEEILKRNLDANISKGIDAQQISYTIEQINAYCNIIQSLDCPITKNNKHKLNGALTYEVMSFLIFTNIKRKIVIGSPEALDKANNTALIKSALFGWWGLPWGFIRTIQAIKVNIKSKKTNHIGMPNDNLRSFVLSKIGQIETYKDNKEKLQEMISKD